ncbi:MAG: PfkB family carbohydrate kinase, partial [Candidatus Rokubacteria bacterium]|nr:PfkB family carbohydrate kinase [Candidatus Rokubacteria bacterium]
MTAHGEVDLVAIGHVTLDRTPSGTRPGGAAYYAAITAHRLGLRVGLLTSFGSDLPRDALPGSIDVENAETRQTTIYTIGTSPAGRTLTLAGRAADLEADRLPVPWRAAPLVLLCPVANEVDPALAASWEGAAVGVLPQGWMRRRGKGGVMERERWPDAAAVLPHVQLLVVSSEDVGDDPEDAVGWFEQVPLAALTRGAAGADLFVNGEPYHIAADPAVPLDETGAGDVFASTLLIEYQREGDPWEAAAAAACAAALSVEGEGVARIPDRAALEARLAAYRRRRGE